MQNLVVCQVTVLEISIFGRFLRKCPKSGLFAAKTVNTGASFSTFTPKPQKMENWKFAIGWPGVSGTFFQEENFLTKAAVIAETLLFGKHFRFFGLTLQLKTWTVERLDLRTFFAEYSFLIKGTVLAWKKLSLAKWALPREWLGPQPLQGFLGVFNFLSCFCTNSYYF